MTTKPKRQPKAKKDDVVPVKGLVVNSADPAIVAETLAAKLPEWDELTQVRRDELVRQSIASRIRPTRGKIGLSKNEETDATVIAPPDTRSGSYGLTIFETFASASSAFVQVKIDEIFHHFHRKKEASEDRINSALAFIGGCSPENEHQAALATQMALIHDASLHAIRCALGAEYMENYDRYMNQANKLSRTLAGLTESYAKLQRGGVQTVKHVNVYEGGQAVVADTVHTGGANGKGAYQAHATGNLGGGAPMLSHNAEGYGVPIAIGARQEALPDARRREG